MVDDIERARKIAVVGLKDAVTGITESVVRKTTTLTEAEQQQVKKHVDYSVELLHQVLDISKPVFEMVHAHHECFNGGGYPRGLDVFEVWADGLAGKAARLA